LVFLVAAGALVGLSFLARTWTARDGPAPAPTARTARRAARPPAAAAAVPEGPQRNVFEFAEAPVRLPTAPEERPPAPAADPAEAVEASPAPPAVRLVGLVRRQGGLRAALSLYGNVVVLGPGDEAEGYRVLSVDEENGVRLRNPDGSEQTLARPAS
jgi:hypothetical protein